MDQYHWDNPDFLAMFAAGNDAASSSNGSSTVMSPATAKNIVAVGATQTALQGLGSTTSSAPVYDAAVTQADGQLLLSFKVVQASFGPDLSASLTSGAFPLAAADPLLGCGGTLANAGQLSGAVVLLERGNCALADKALAAQDAGAAGALIFDNVLGGYFVAAANGTGGDAVTVPTASITRRLGHTLATWLASGITLQISLTTAGQPDASFQNLAAYSAQGPTSDGRVKPDLVAPGSLYSALAVDSGAQVCGLTGMQGTSMATPVVAGAAALVRQYYVDGWYPSGAPNATAAFTPSGALVKATLISGASSLTGYEALTGLPVDPPPSFRQGFGRVQLSERGSGPGGLVFFFQSRSPPAMQPVAFPLVQGLGTLCQPPPPPNEPPSCSQTRRCRWQTWAALRRLPRPWPCSRWTGWRFPRATATATACGRRGAPSP